MVTKLKVNCQRPCTTMVPASVARLIVLGRVARSGCCVERRICTTAKSKFTLKLRPRFWVIFAERHLVKGQRSSTSGSTYRRGSSYNHSMDEVNTWLWPFAEKMFPPERPQLLRVNLSTSCKNSHCLERITPAWSFLGSATATTQLRKKTRRVPVLWAAWLTSVSPLYCTLQLFSISLPGPQRAGLDSVKAYLPL